MGIIERRHAAGPACRSPRAMERPVDLDFEVLPGPLMSTKAEFGWPAAGPAGVPALAVFNAEIETSYKFKPPSLDNGPTPRSAGSAPRLSARPSGANRPTRFRS